MTMPPLFLRLRALVLGAAKSLEWLPPTLTRLGVGLLFLRTGWGKVNNLANVTEYFAGLGIPLPGVNAVLAASTELGGGVLLLLGLGTRVVTLPLAVVMGVALATAKRGDIEGLQSLFGLAETLYIVLFAWLFARGAGPVSLDALLEKRRVSKSGSAATP